MMETIEDKAILLDDEIIRNQIKEGQWIAKKSAIIIFHGVGNQKPFETLDTFTRGMLKTYTDAGLDASLFLLSHKFAKRDNGHGGNWFDNFIRVTYKDSKNYLDIYEFYWAPETENKVSMLDVQNWVQSLTKGAKEFYQNQKEMGKKFHDESFFFDKNGDFKEGRYRRFLKFVGIFIPLLESISETFFKLISYIPVIGTFGYNKLKSSEKNSWKILSNVIGDVVAYNSTDPKNKLFATRRAIQKRAYTAIKYLIEPVEQDNKQGDTPPLYAYDKVIIAAHSLGTQIAFDALNTLNHRISLNEVKGIDADGYFKSGDSAKEPISKLLCGFITFGSHLDKAAFFFREYIPKDAYIRQQIYSNFYAFKQKKWTQGKDDEFELKSPYRRYLDKIEWRNYYDPNDPIGGHLDYYKNVININCNFTKKSSDHPNYGSIRSIIDHLIPFTHSYYWTDKRMYSDIIVHYLK